MTTFNTVEDVLEHFGVKGMKWGVRKSKESRAAGKIAKLDRKVEKAANSPDTHMQLWTHSVTTLKKSGDLKRINAKPEYAAAKMRLRAGVANRPLQKKYEDEVASKLMEHLKKNANEIVNRSATRQFDVQVATRVDIQRASKNKWRIVTRDLQQADDGSLEITVVRDAVGRIIDLIPEGGALQQSDLVGPFLEHFGVKGMKWGQRKARPLSEDAQTKQAVKTQIRSQKVGSVSNAQLQAAIRRMQLEQDYKRLSINEKSGVNRWLASTLTEIGKREVQAYAAKKLTVAALKKVATGGVA